MRVAISKYYTVMRMTWIQALEYKANTIVGLFAVLSGVLIEYILWDRIYETRGVEIINGFTFNQLIVYIFFGIMVGQLKSSWVTSFEMIDCIRGGGLNKYLIRPVSFFSYHFSLFIGYNSLFYFSYFTMIILFQIIFPGWAFHTPNQAIVFIIFLAMAVYLSYSIYFLMICGAFWFGEVRTLILAFNLSNRIFTGAIIPLEFFPETIRNIIFLTPLPYLVNIPVNIALGNINSLEWSQLFIKGIIWVIVMTLAGQMLYKIGIRKYEGFGG
jgi:ABC-2 type transport system permease protein